MSSTSFPSQNRAKTVLKTTVVLTVTTLFARTIAVSYNVYLAGKIGTIGIGFFELIMSVYAFAKTAATAGVSLAATRMSAEDPQKFLVSIKKLITICLAVGLFCSLILILLSDTLCTRLLNSPPGGTLALRLLAVSLPFLSVSSALGGFFVAERKMGLYAPIQIAEQLIRVLLTVLLLEHFSGDSLGYSICGICLAITLSEVVAVLFSSIFFVTIRRKTPKSQATQKPKTSAFLRAFSRLAAPVAFGALFRASLNTFYNILVPIGLKKSGASADRALSGYGTVQGMALPILLYPSALMSVLSLQLVPEIAALHAKKKIGQITYITQRVLRFSLLFSILCAGVLFFYASELSQLIFQSTGAAPFIRALAPLVPIMYLDTVTDGILKGLDLQLKVLRIGIVDSLLSLSLIYFLLPPFAMVGYLITIYAGESINTFLGQIEVRKHVKIKQNVLCDILMPILSIAAGCVGVKSFLRLSHTSANVIGTAFAILASVVVSLLLLVITRALKKEELQWLKGLIRLHSSEKERGFGERKNSHAAHTRTAKDHRSITRAGNANRSEM